jgi:drug/metabolite transporter (DMT)-like permease
MQWEARPPAWMTLAAFAVIYFVWGSTYLAIRVGVREVPPFLLAGLRFLFAGLVLYGWMLARGVRSPDRRQWISVLLLAVLIFIFDYGLLFWAERRVASGVAAVILATIPVFIALAEIAFLRTQRLTPRLAAALLIGIVGVAVLVSGSLGASLRIAGAPVNRAGAAALIVSAISWSIATILTRKLPLPESKAMSSGAQMLAGGILLFLASGLLGEFRDFHPAAVSAEAWLVLLYLSIAGSVIGFTAYIWLIHHESPTKVGTYAYVNPVVAVLMGYFFGGEPLGARTVLGTLLVLVSVLVITMQPAKKRLAAVAPGAA